MARPTYAQCPTCGCRTSTVWVYRCPEHHLFCEQCSGSKTSPLAFLLGKNVPRCPRCGEAWQKVVGEIGEGDIRSTADPTIDAKTTGNAKPTVEQTATGGTTVGVNAPLRADFGVGVSIGIVALAAIVLAVTSLSNFHTAGVNRTFLGQKTDVPSPPQRTDEPVVQAPVNKGLSRSLDEKFVSDALRSIDLQWKEIFSKSSATYRGPVLVFYREDMDQPCGDESKRSMGSFYCPENRHIYIDISFLREIEQRFRTCVTGSPCQLAQAYVIAHEVGHHVQNLLGILSKMRNVQRGLSKEEADRLQLRFELQADCFAGLWAHGDERWKVIQPGDIEGAMQTVSAIGSDKLQKQMGYVMPDPFTHGSLEQRQRWFLNGLNSGTIAACNTFRPPEL